MSISPIEMAVSGFDQVLKLTPFGSGRVLVKSSRRDGATTQKQVLLNDEGTPPYARLWHQLSIHLRDTFLTA